LFNIAVRASGMVTSVGLNAPATCAAIRCGLTNFAETRFMDKNGKWITGGYVPLDQPWRGRTKLIHLVVPAIRECLAVVEGIPTDKIPLFLCVAEKERPGRLDGLDDLLLGEVQKELNFRFHENSAVISQGRVGGVHAIRQATTLLYQERLSYCIVAGVDTFLTAGTLAAFEENDRILTETNSDGFIPGEAGAAILLCPESKISNDHITIKGIGFGKENAFIDSGEPLRADGLVKAINEASKTSGMTLANLNYRITDANGEQYGFKEAALALTRTLKERKEEFDIWHPVECIGEVGAAIAPVVVGVAFTAAKKGYALGNGVLCHFGNDDGHRAAMFLSYSNLGGT
jgi:3-oxoacyl-[acyl-carrier-protein] synthase-1